MDYKKLKKARGIMSIKKVADKLGRDRATVWNWETGKNEPKLKDLQAMAKLYDCTLKDLGVS